MLSICYTVCIMTASKEETVHSGFYVRPRTIVGVGLAWLAFTVGVHQLPNANANAEKFYPDRQECPSSLPEGQALAPIKDSDIPSLQQEVGAVALCTIDRDSFKIVAAKP